MFFKILLDAIQFFVQPGHSLFQARQVFGILSFILFIKRIRCADTCNHIFSLCVDQPLSVEYLFSGCRISCECNSCSAIVAHVAKNHSLNVYRSSPFISYAFNFSVCDRPLTIPALENSADASPKLFEWVVRKIFTKNIFYLGFIDVYQFFKIFSRKLGVIFNPTRFFHTFQLVFELFTNSFSFLCLNAGSFFHNYVRVHGD